MRLTVARRPAQVLLVEDNQMQAVLAKNAIGELESLELVHRAEDGDAALAYLRKEGDFKNAPRPDVILLDLNMPKKNGFEVLEEVKCDAKLRAIPVIVFTTSEYEEDIAKAYANGASTFITKPSDFDQLLSILEDLGRYWRNAKLATA
jgi:CheY-like chemotaxis protein